MDLMSNLSLDASSKRDVQGAPKALIKGLALVELVAAADAPIRLTDLVDRGGLPRPTALRLLDVLRDHGVLQATTDGRYTLGPRLAAWGQQYLDQVDLRILAADVMDALAVTTRETCFLGVRDDLQVLYVAKADSPQAVRPAARIGSRNPLHSTAIGKALLAFGPAEILDRCLQQRLVEKTPNTITDPGQLREELALTRQRGYATDNVENEDGVRCVAAPVRDHAGSTVAAMSVSAPAYRFELGDLPKLSSLVTTAAEELSRSIGFRPADSAQFVEPGDPKEESQ